MSNTKTLKAEIELDVKDYNKALEEASKKTNKTNKDIEKSSNSTSKTIDKNNKTIINSTKKMRASTVSDMEKIKKAKKSLQSTASSSSKSIKGSLEGVGTTSNSVKSKFKSAMSNMASSCKSAVSTIKAQATAMGNAFKDVIPKIKLTEQQLKKFDSLELSNVGNEISNLGGKLTSTITMPTITGAVSSAGLYMNYETAMAKISTIVDMSDKELDNYGDNIKAKAKEMGVSVGEYAEAVYQSISASVDYKEAIDFVAGSVKLAKGGFTDTLTAVDGLTSTLNSYGEMSGGPQKVMDMLVATQNKGKTTVGELAGSMKDILTNGKLGAVALEQLLASMASLTAQGVPTAEAGTRIKAMLEELGDTGSEVGKIIQEKTGKSFKQLMKEGKTLPEVLSVLSSYAKEAGLELNNVFSSGEAGASASAIMNENASAFKDSLETIKDSAGMTEEAYNKMKNTASETLKTAINGVLTELIELGEKLTPAIDAVAKIIEKVGEVIEWFTNLDPATQSSIMTVIAMLASLGPLMAISGFLTSLANPVNLIALVLWGLIALIVSLATEFDSFLEGGLITTGAIVESIEWVFKTIFMVLKNIFFIGVGIFASILEVFTSSIEIFVRIIKLSVESIWEIISGIVESIILLFTEGFDACGERLGEIFENIGLNISGTLEDIIESVKKCVKRIGECFSGIKWDLPDWSLPTWATPKSENKTAKTINWNSEGAIFTRPTIFGGQGVGDGFKGNGAQKEAVIPLDKLEDFININSKSSNLSVNIDNFNNNSKQDIEQIANELAFYMRRKGAVI